MSSHSIIHRLLFTIVPVVLFTLITSCKKNYKCTCYVTEFYQGANNQYKVDVATVDYKYKSKNTDEARGACNNDHAVSYIRDGSNLISITCNIKE